jgi:hypothetical protein
VVGTARVRSSDPVIREGASTVISRIGNVRKKTALQFRFPDHLISRSPDLRRLLIRLVTVQGRDFHLFPQDFPLSHRISTGPPLYFLEPQPSSVDSFYNANVRYLQTLQIETISNNRQARPEGLRSPA